MDKKIPEWCAKVVGDWFFDPREKHSQSEIMTACSYIFQVWLTYHDYNPQRRMAGTRRSCQEAFASAFFEIYRKCQKKKRKMVFADFKELDIPQFR